MDEEIFNNLQKTVLTLTLDLATIQRVLRKMGQTDELKEQKKAVTKQYPDIIQALKILENKKF